MAKQGMKRPEYERKKNDFPPVPEISGGAKHGHNQAAPLIDNNFPSTSVKSVVKEYDDFSYHYDVYLADGTTLEFDRKGEWTDVQNRVSGVPDSVVPEKILTYVTTNYSNAFIVDIERERQYNVELNTDLDLDFSLDGDFIRIDY